MIGFNKLKKYKTGITPEWNYDTFKMAAVTIKPEKHRKEVGAYCSYHEKIHSYIIQEEYEAEKTLYEYIKNELEMAKMINADDFKVDGKGNPFYLGQIIVLTRIMRKIKI